MKKIFLSILTVTIAVASFAQNTKRSGYVAKSSTYKFKEDKVGVPMKGYYILKNGEEVEAIIAYNKPEFFVGDFAAGASLYICKTLTGKPVGLFDPNDSNHKEYINKDDIKAFFIDGYLYANVKKVGWRIVLSEGAIHNYIQVVKMKKGDKNYYVHFKRKQWFQDEPFGSALAPISTKNHLAMIEKLPPTASAASVGKFKKIVADYKANLISLNEAEVRYNICFDNNSEMLIDYILGDDGLTQKVGDAAAAEQAAKDKAAADRKKYDDDQKAQQEAGQNAHYAPKQDPFKGRTTTVSDAVASVKPEVKVKKEKFLARINRIKADGNKVGVIVRCSNIGVNPKFHTFFSNQKTQLVRGAYKPIKGIETIATKTVEELNKGFNTDVFEVIDIKEIPFKEDGNGKKIDDWWKTKYKVIIFYYYNPYYTAYVQTGPESTKAKKEFKAQMFVKSGSFMMAAEDGEKKMKSAGSSPKSASYSSEIYVAGEDTRIMMIQDLKEVVNPASDEAIVEQLTVEQLKYLAKFIKKKNK
jgi:hypothetical protein